MSPIRFVLKSFLACAILLSQSAYNLNAMAQAPQPDPYARKLQAYDPNQLVSMNVPANPAPSKIEPMTGSYVGSQWDYFTYANYGWGNSTGWDIYFNNGNANPTVVPLAPGKYDELQPRFSPKANKVIFISNRGGNHFEIYSINPDGTGLKQLTKNTSDDVYPAFSPDGSQVVFQAYRDGQPEIYKMKVDGTGATRLTTNSAAYTNYDGMPAWSPDGRQIAFVTNRAGQYDYQLWLMNADGSSQFMLENLPWCAHPVWSSDGKTIAFDAAPSMSSFQSVWLYSLETQRSTLLASSNSGLDYEVNAFMPGGRYVGFTSVDNVTTDFVTFLNSLDNFGVDIQIQTGQVKPMYFTTDSTGSAIWSFDWQTQDSLPPSTIIQPLPAISPAPFTLRWSAQDAGPSGIDSYQLQYRTSPADTWQDISQNIYSIGESLSVSGTHGQAFYYRVRAFDKAGNIEAWKPANEWTTTVESLPPHVTLYPSARYAPPTGIYLDWLGWDDGGSGIDHYEFASCSGGEYFTQHNHLFAGLPGNDILFCARAVDHAGNISGWSLMPNKVAFYASALSGRVLNNQGFPVNGAQVDLSASPLALFPSDINGNYRAYTKVSDPPVSLGWTKPDYGVPTRWLLSNGPQFFKDVYLPPANDLVANGGFENDLSAADWQAGGDIPPQISQLDPYLGSSAVRLAGPRFTPPVDALNNSDEGCSPQFAVSSSGTIYVIWRSANFTSGTGFALKPAGGDWSSPVDFIQAVGGNPSTMANPTIIMTSDDTLLLVYNTTSGLYSSTRRPDGTWTAPTVIYNGALGHINFSLKADNQGALHLILSTHDGYNLRVFYYKWYAGNWSAATLIDGPLSTYYQPNSVIGLDNQNNLVVIFWRIGDQHIEMARQLTGGAWTALTSIPVTMALNWSLKLAIDGTGSIYIAYEDLISGPLNLSYIKFDPAASAWSLPVLVSPVSIYAEQYELVASSDGNVHLVWTENINASQSALKYSLLSSGAGPSSVETPYTPETGGLHFAVDKGLNGALHFMVVNDAKTVYYFQHTADGKFTPPFMVAKSSTVLSSAYLVVAPNGLPHLFWGGDTRYLISTFSYSSIQVAAQDGASTLSQTVSIPDTMQNPGLSFMYSVVGPAGAGADFKVSVTAAAGASTLFTAPGVNLGYRHAWVDMSLWKGQQVTLTFAMAYHQGQPVPEAMLDEVSLGDTFPDSWVSLSPAEIHLLPGQSLSLTLSYGAHGLPIAPSVLSLQLPSQFELVSATTQPAADAGTLTWNVDALSPQDGDQSIGLVLRLKSDASAFTDFPLTAAFASPTLELETSDNTAQATIHSEVTAYLPIAIK